MGKDAWLKTVYQDLFNFLTFSFFFELVWLFLDFLTLYGLANKFFDATAVLASPVLYFFSRVLLFRLLLLSYLFFSKRIKRF